MRSCMSAIDRIVRVEIRDELAEVVGENFLTVDRAREHVGKIGQRFALRIVR